MNKTTLLLTVLLTSLTTVSAQAADVVKAEKVNNVNFAKHAKQTLSVELDNIQLDITPESSVKLAKAKLDNKAKLNTIKLNKSNSFIANR